MTAAPESTLPYPPLHKDKKFVVLSDWYVYLFLLLLGLAEMASIGMARLQLETLTTVRVACCSIYGIY